MIDADFQNLSTVHSNLQPKPKTVASAATIEPTTFLTIVTGTISIATVTPPINAMHMLALVFVTASPGVFVTTGNLVTAYQPVINRPILMIYEPTLGKYYQAAVV